jgi:dTDP-glucose 4,6-dehydratase
VTRILVAGGAGFIGSNFVLHILEQHPDYEVLVVDKLTYAGNMNNLTTAFARPRFSFQCLDICDPAIVDAVRGCGLVINFAAESHVDRSIDSAKDFVRSNIEGAWQLLEACRRAGTPRFLQVSTDEVYGSLGPSGSFREDTPLSPNSPYSATKAAADLMVRAYVKTHGLPALITRCSNNYGPFQFPEKFIPLMIMQALSGDFLPVYGDGENVRDWIHVADHCHALDLVLHQGREGEIYNIGGECEMKNIDVARDILRILGLPETMIRMVQDRPGHDRRYSVDCSKLKQELSWRPVWKFSSGLEATVSWYRDHPAWIEQIRNGQYMEYFDRHYKHRKAVARS